MNPYQPGEDNQDPYEVGYKAGAASRDAEVANLKDDNEYLYVAAIERDQLREQVKMLREALEYCVTQVGELATVPGIASALSSTPEQSLAAYRNKVIEECAEVCDAQAKEWNSDSVVLEKNYAAFCSEAIIAMKEQP